MIPPPIIETKRQPNKEKSPDPPEDRRPQIAEASAESFHSTGYELVDQVLQANRASKDTVAAGKPLGVGQQTRWTLDSWQARSPSV